MKVVVAGASGNTAKRLLRRLAERGHETRGLVRKEEQLRQIQDLGAEPWLLDLEDAGPDEVERAVEGCDAVVFAAGAGPGSGPERKQTMDYGGAVKLIEAARSRGLERYLMLSTMNADNPEAMGEKMRPYLEAKAAADEHLRQSGLEYTIIRPGSLTDDAGTGLITASRHIGGRGEITREDVAEAFAVALQEPATSRETVDILAGDTPVAEALRSFE